MFNKGLSILGMISFNIITSISYISLLFLRFKPFTNSTISETGAMNMELNISGFPLRESPFALIFDGFVLFFISFR